MIWTLYVMFNDSKISHSMKQSLIVLKLTIIVSLLFTLISVAQAPSAIVWDMAVGCESKTDVYYFDVEDMQECIKTCQNSTVTFTLVGDPSPWTDVQWLVSGGTVQSSSNQDVVILWGSQSIILNPRRHWPTPFLT